MESGGVDLRTRSELTRISPDYSITIPFASLFPARGKWPASADSSHWLAS